MIKSVLFLQIEWIDHNITIQLLRCTLFYHSHSGNSIVNKGNISIVFYFQSTFFFWPQIFWHTLTRGLINIERKWDLMSFHVGWDRIKPIPSWSCQVKTQYLQILNIIDSSIKRAIKLIHSMVGYIGYVWYGRYCL